MLDCISGGILLDCLFCKKESTNSKSVEHIVPESLGNKSDILPKGVVCDKCNNYFSRKVEKPFFNLEATKSLRFRQEAPNKRGNIPSINGLLNLKYPTVIHKNLKESFYGSIELSSDGVNHIMQNQKGFIVSPIVEYDSRNTSVISRFLAKVALEAMAKRLMRGEVKYKIGQ